MAGTLPPHNVRMQASLFVETSNNVHTLRRAESRGSRHLSLGRGLLHCLHSSTTRACTLPHCKKGGVLATCASATHATHIAQTGAIPATAGDEVDDAAHHLVDRERASLFRGPKKLRGKHIGRGVPTMRTFPRDRQPWGGGKRNQ